MKNFLLYAGCGRAGSTWLYGALNARGDCDFSHIKEHFLFVPFTLNPEFDKNNFFNHYHELAKNPSVKLLGEMSPSNQYASLQDLNRFKEEADSRGFNVLPVMTLRDPINQIMSSTKLFQNTKHLSKYVSSSSPEELSTAIRKMMAGEIPKSNLELTLEDIIQHGNEMYFDKKRLPWKTTYDNFIEVFGKIHVNFYETLFTDSAMNDLCEYLGIPFETFNFNEVLNKQGNNIPLSNDDKHKIYSSNSMLAENYQFAVEKFGKDFIESIWWTPNK